MLKQGEFFEKCLTKRRFSGTILIESFGKGNAMQKQSVKPASQFAAAKKNDRVFCFLMVFFLLFEILMITVVLARSLSGASNLPTPPTQDEGTEDSTDGATAPNALPVFSGGVIPSLPKETADTIDADGWLHSGDLGTYDQDGYYRITGRLKDMIIRGGENIYPREIEEFLRSCPAVKDVEVVGIPDERYGEVAGAFLIYHDGQEKSEEEMRDFCRNRIAFYKTPKYFFSVKEFPQTASGKIQKFKLRELAKELLGITGSVFQNDTKQK